MDLAIVCRTILPCGSGEAQRHPQAQASSGCILGQTCCSQPTLTCSPEMSRTVFSYFDKPLAGAGPARASNVTLMLAVSKSSLNRLKPRSLQKPLRRYREAPTSSPASFSRRCTFCNPPLTASESQPITWASLMVFWSTGAWKVLATAFISTTTVGSSASPSSRKFGQMDSLAVCCSRLGGSACTQHPSGSLVPCSGVVWLRLRLKVCCVVGL